MSQVLFGLNVITNLLLEHLGFCKQSIVMSRDPAATPSRPPLTWETALGLAIPYQDRLRSIGAFIGRARTYMRLIEAIISSWVHASAAGR